MSLFLVLDQGGQSVRALIISQNGEVLTMAQHAIDTTYAPPDRVEQDPEEIVTHLIKCAQLAIEQLADKQQSEITAAGLVTQRATMLAVQKSTQTALTPVISWQDRRGAAALLANGISNQQIQKITGLRLSPHYGVGKMRWCIEHLPEAKAALAANDLVFTPIASFLLQQLTQQQDYYCDPVNASRTLLMDKQTIEWSKLLLNHFQIPITALPTIRSNHSEFGELVIENFKLPLRYLNGDQACALFSNGKPSSDTLFINLGTGAFICRVTDNDDEHLLRSLVHVDDTSLSVLEGTVNGAATALKQVTTELSSGSSEPSISDIIHLVSGLADQIPIFLNGVGGLGAPFWVAEFNSEFRHPRTLQKDDTAPVESKLTAVVESIIFLLMMLIRRLSAHPPALKQIEISGGLSRLDYLCQSLADLSGLEVLRQDEKEGTALGCAWWLAGCPNEWRSNAETQRFTPCSAPVLAQRFAAWQQAMKAALPADRAVMFDNQPQPYAHPVDLEAN